MLVTFLGRKTDFLYCFYFNSPRRENHIEKLYKFHINGLVLFTLKSIKKNERYSLSKETSLFESEKKILERN